MSLEVNDGHTSPVVAGQRMVEKCDLAARRRETEIADPSRRFIQHVAGRILQAASMNHAPRDRKIRAILVPVGVNHVVEQLARGAAPQWNPRQAAGGVQASKVRLSETASSPEREMPSKSAFTLSGCDCSVSVRAENNVMGSPLTDAA